MSLKRTPFPLISIVIATFNSEKTLSKTLISIRKQNYPQNKIEILVIDGGSTDNTLSIAKKYKAKIISNPKTELLYAKEIGFKTAKGSYLMYLDSDESLENRFSIALKLSVFKKNPKIKAVTLSGYKTPPRYASINNYINEFGDPFSFFMYRESKGDLFFYKEFMRKYPNRVIDDNKDYVSFDFSNEKNLPLIELWAGGCMIDLPYVKKTFPKIHKHPELIAHVFYLMNEKKKLLAITKNDPTIHYSCPSLWAYFKKLQSRIKNNIFTTKMGEGGYSGRETFNTSSLQFKKYLFIVYSFTFFLPIFDSIILLLTRKKSIYLIHWILSTYTSFLICFYYMLKFMHITPALKTYGK